MKLSSDVTLFLAQLKGDGKFKLVMKNVKEARPVIPSYRPQETRDMEAQLVEQMKYETARQQGFDLLYQILTGERNE